MPSVHLTAHEPRRRNTSKSPEYRKISGDDENIIDCDATGVNQATTPLTCETAAFDGSVDTSAAAKSYPYGRSVFWHLIERDHEQSGTPKAVLLSYAVVMGLMLTFYLPFLSSFLAYSDATPLLSSYRPEWDRIHSIDFDMRNILTVLLKLLEESMGIEPKHATYIALYGTILPYALLFLADLIDCLYCWWWLNGTVVSTTTATTTENISNEKTFKDKPQLASNQVGLFQWPLSWHTENTTCYNDMFCEPTRCMYMNQRYYRPCLVRRPGNTYSNILYVFTAEIILFSCFMNPTTETISSTPGSSSYDNHYNQYLIPDAMVGFMLFILSIASTIWHAANAPKVHYIDLWSMDSCIIFPTARISFIAIQKALGNTPLPFNISVPHLCAVFYLLVILALGLKCYLESTNRVYDRGFPPSGRYRLFTKDTSVTRGRSSCFRDTMLFACMYGSIPVFSVSFFLAIEVNLFPSGGSLLMNTVMYTVFSIGWGPRMLERFFFDGWAPMEWIALLRQRLLLDRTGSTPTEVLQNVVSSCICTSLSALLSVTAWLHYFTGIVLLLGYMNGRILSESI